MDEVLQVRGLRRSFESEGGPVRALRGVDLSLATGEFVAVMGPSGCGKSTLLNLVAGLDAPSDGEVVIRGESLAGRDENDLARMRRRHIGFVFQFFHLLEEMTALENVIFPAVIAGASRRDAEHRAHGLLDLLGLPDKEQDLPAVLSGGQRQRLAIARAGERPDPPARGRADRRAGLRGRRGDPRAVPPPPPARADDPARDPRRGGRPRCGTRGAHARRARRG